jgi:hypothetical protein
MRSCDAFISGDIALRTSGAYHGGSRPARRSVPHLAARRSWSVGLDHCSVPGVSGLLGLHSRVAGQQERVAGDNFVRLRETEAVWGPGHGAKDWRNERGR